jgi:iron complex transport system substrate-binding protein
MKTKLISLLLAFCLLLSLAACGGKKSDLSISLTDQCGRTVELDAPAQRVVSCYYVSSYAMMALGLSDRLVGIENKAATRPIYAMSAPQFLDLPAVGTMKECNVELIASLEPDLVIMPKKLAEAAQTLTDLGLTVMLVNPEDHASLQEMLSLIATACGEALRVEQLLSYYSAQMTKLENLMADAEKPTVYMGGNSSYLTAAPGAMYQSSLITLAGGVNAAAALEGNYWTEVSYEAILTYDPDVIVIPSGADYTAEDIRNDAQLSALKAVKNGAIYAMPDGIEEWDSPIPSGILGAMWLASVLHPERYSPETFVGDATGFYENFYGFTPDPTLLK